MINRLEGNQNLKNGYKKRLNNKTQCPYCSMQCTMMFQKNSNSQQKRETVSPNKQDPVSKGRLCIKGVHAHVNVYNQQRLTTPLLRVEGNLVPVSWKVAMGWFKEKIKELQNTYGENSISVYGSGSMTNEKCYLLGKFARIGLGTRYIDYNGRFCMSAAAMASNQAFGIDRGMTNPISDIPYATCIILAGTNVADCQPTLIPYFKKAKEIGCKIIVIDPRETGTSKLADIHLKIKPGTDAALVNGILKVLIQEGYVNHSFIEKATEGFDALYQYISQIDLSEVSQLAGVTIQEIIEVAHMYGQAATGLVYTARGVEQHASGVQNVRNYINLVLVTGKIGKRGSGFGTITGQANGQGGREHGQKADQLPGYRSIDNLEDRKHIAKIWDVNEISIPDKGVSAYELFELIDNGDIHGMIVMGSNPVVSNPNANFVKEMLEKLNCLIVVDLFLSETAQLADLVLPGSSYLEDEGTITNLEGRVLLRRAVNSVPIGAKLDWEILCEMASVLGRGKYFSYKNTEEIFEELRRASKEGKADYFGITYKRIEDHGGIFWPCPDLNHNGTKRMFANHQFFHPDKKAKFIPVINQGPKESIGEEYPLILTTGRVLHHYLSGVQTRLTPELYKKYPAPLLEIHPVTAGKLNLIEGEKVRVRSKRGEIQLKIKISPGIRKDTVFVPFHWGGEQSINRLTNPVLDPQCRMPEFKVCAVRIEPLYKKESVLKPIEEEVEI
ncbi:MULTISPECIES: assimilatory nitrate reductase catalytic subunit NasC [Bacillus cereus group]|uniref:assimilatory nitrate reductase catalytic subunit NasC n=1 Tax=Bacillus cereus group TaxID=86661 RepID=UPI0006A87909|nr:MULTISPECIES: molybdopterin oxidoreductase family protein [Bacillus cereus group]OOZ83486.1 nitrite reductase [Bacillus cereus]OPD59683.1 nitrite reductase [Bacillus anthracis]CUB42844.1 Assimilatory nitrate reductase catalytic subunit [Bacillus cereus]